MFNDLKILQTIIGNLKLKIKKYQLHYGLLNYCHDK